MVFRFLMNIKELKDLILYILKSLNQETSTKTSENDALLEEYM